MKRMDVYLAILTILLVNNNNLIRAQSVSCNLSEIVIDYNWYVSPPYNQSDDVDQSYFTESQYTFILLGQQQQQLTQLFLNPAQQNFLSLSEQLSTTTGNLTQIEEQTRTAFLQYYSDASLSLEEQSGAATTIYAYINEAQTNNHTDIIPTLIQYLLNIYYLEINTYVVGINTIEQGFDDAVVANSTTLVYFYAGILAYVENNFEDVINQALSLAQQLLAIVSQLPDQDIYGYADDVTQQILAIYTVYDELLILKIEQYYNYALITLQLQFYINELYITSGNFLNNIDQEVYYWQNESQINQTDEGNRLQQELCCVYGIVNKAIVDLTDLQQTADSNDAQIIQTLIDLLQYSLLNEILVNQLLIEYELGVGFTYNCE